MVENDKQKHGFDICKYVNKKAKLAIELARFNKSFNDDDSLRHLLLYPKHSSFLAALYKDKTFDVQALIQGGTLQRMMIRYNFFSSNALGNGRSTSMEFFTSVKKWYKIYTFGKETDYDVNQSTHHK